jgi:hypothetical protein
MVLRRYLLLFVVAWALCFVPVAMFLRDHAPLKPYAFSIVAAGYVSDQGREYLPTAGDIYVFLLNRQDKMSSLSAGPSAGYHMRVASLVHNYFGVRVRFLSKNKRNAERFQLQVLALVHQYQASGVNAKRFALKRHIKQYSAWLHRHKDQQGAPSLNCLYRKFAGDFENAKYREASLVSAGVSEPLTRLGHYPSFRWLLMLWALASVFCAWFVCLLYRLVCVARGSVL